MQIKARKRSQAQSGNMCVIPPASGILRRNATGLTIEISKTNPTGKGLGARGEGPDFGELDSTELIEVSRTGARKEMERARNPARSAELFTPGSTVRRRPG